MVRGNTGFLAFWTALFLVLSLAVGAQQKEPRPDSGAPADGHKKELRSDTSASADATEKAKAGAILYQPPPRGAPRVRIGGGVRGARAMATPLALVPEHVALTTRAAPALFWHLDGVPSDQVRIFFTLIEEGRRKPLVERELRRPKNAGIQRLRLQDFGVTLKSGVIYQWSIALVRDMSQRSHDLVALGYVKRVAPRDKGARDASGQAGAGLWYDAFETLSDQIDRAPKAKEPRAARNALLTQVGLDAAVQ